MHFERRAAVFEVVTLIDDVKGQLARFAHDRQPHAQAIGDWCAEDKSARFDSQHHVDLAEPWLRDLVDDRREATRLADKGRDVPEENSGFRKVRYIANQLFDFVARHLDLYGGPPAGVQS